MAYPLLILLDLFGILLFDLFLLANVKIVQDAPPTMMPGTEVKVTVTIEKGDLTGFAKLQIDLPEGLTATAIETKGASFTFADQKAKFIWMALPSSPTFKVSYDLVAAPTASGALPISGRFSYIEENERRTYDLPTTTVTIMGDASVAEEVVRTGEGPAMEGANDIVSAAGAVPVEPAQEMPGTSITEPPKEVDGTARNVRVVDSPEQGAGGVTVSRKITPVTETEMLVEVSINKGTIRGFGKLQEELPQGFSALEKNSAQAIFTTNDRIAKFVWLNLPEGPEMKVTYKLRANGRPEGTYELRGEFGYLVNDETQRVNIGTSAFLIGPKALESLASEITPDENKDLAETGLPAIGGTKDNTDKVNEGEQRKVLPPVKEDQGVSKGIPTPEQGITYKVQITAAHREVGRDYFMQRHHFSGDLNVERHEGWIKYTTGRFTEYRQARDQRIALVAAGHRFPGPFVTAYNNGDRVTVQEALMVSHQQWVQ
ncbi:MAG: hypothetical protein H6595_03235 [Flavobacteriales bacterium]|nr:hypothetical protein [Flavobacteriales bacterium]MCB9166471.1 hypothetical protein [Flavobacteriales bacterium]